MKVNELISFLQKLDGNLEVVCVSEDENILSSNQLFKLFYIENIDIIEGEKTRDQDNTPSFKLGQSVSSQTLATIGITSDF